MQDFLFYLKLGWEHIISIDALDHQLFIMALITIFSIRSFNKILILITAFTIGHSVTLVLSILDVIRMNSKLVEILIPFTILYTGIQNLIRNESSNSVQVKYLTALFFGLIHGMGFANSARLMIAKEQTIAVPVLGFNVGVELGQILVVVIVISIFYLLEAVFKLRTKYRIISLSVVVIILSIKMILERL